MRSLGYSTEISVSKKTSMKSSKASFMKFVARSFHFPSTQQLSIFTTYFYVTFIFVCFTGAVLTCKKGELLNFLLR